MLFLGQASQCGDEERSQHPADEFVRIEVVLHATREPSLDLLVRLVELHDRQQPVEAEGRFRGQAFGSLTEGVERDGADQREDEDPP